MCFIYYLALNLGFLTLTSIKKKNYNSFFILILEISLIAKIFNKFLNISIVLILLLFLLASLIKKINVLALFS